MPDQIPSEPMQRRARGYSAYRPMNAGRLRLLGMDSAVWQRHASGWSVWTRFATLPFLFLAVWAHGWYGWPTAIALVAAVCVWLWLNPRIFPPPRRLDSWHARATFGERVWLNRGVVPIPPADNRQAVILSLVTGAGFLVGMWGAIALHVPAVIVGTLLTYAGKLAFLKSMARLYDVMRDAHPVYRSWTVVPVNDNLPDSGCHSKTGS
ncbi:DUF6653 family protein [Stappia stellulata]|uniref:DUF6653 family protein n=1 Tax=Stappia stellulata TaxID=71235 RepID=UPI001AD90685|nr:DUF6653 family protein [Stappia stellulata]